MKWLFVEETKTVINVDKIRSIETKSVPYGNVCIVAYYSYGDYPEFDIIETTNFKDLNDENNRLEVERRLIDIAYRLGTVVFL